jgi:ligand-binding sensor domain-containing protein/DNA-binding CsgD family transcriptional regulator
MRVVGIGCVLIMLWLLPAKASAQHKYSQFYPINNIISKELIKAITKDSSGYLWLATDDGVLRFDGDQTRFFHKGISSRYTKGFLKLRDGRLLLVTDAGVQEITTVQDSIYFRSLTIGNRVFDDPLNYPKTAYEDQAGNIWVGEMNSVTRYNANGVKSFMLGEDFRSIDYHRSFSFAEDAFGNLWIAPHKGPLLFYDKAREAIERIRYGIDFTGAKGIVCVKGDHLLVGGREGIMVLKVDSDHHVLSRRLFSGVSDISVLKVISETDIYVGTGSQGLYYFNMNNWDGTLQRLSNVPIKDILDIFYDKSKEELWITGSEDIGLFKPSMISKVNSVGEHRIETLTTDDQEGIYYSIGEEIYHLPAYQDSPKLIRADKSTYFHRILFERGGLWIGDAFGQVSFLDLDRRAQEIFSPGTDLSIRYLNRDRQGNKWFTGHTKGLIRIDDTGRLKFYDKVLESVAVRTSGEGDLYVIANGRENLLWRFDSLSDQFVPMKLRFEFDCPATIQANDLQFDRRGNLYLATDEGLLLLAKTAGEYESVQLVRVGELEARDPVRALALHEDHLIFANTSGLVVYREGQYVLFNQDGGLPSKIVKERGLEWDRAGNLLVATAKGLALLKPESLAFRQSSPPVFSTVRVNGRSVLISEVEEFPFKSHMEAQFISLTYPATNIVYQTRIIELDPVWSSASPSRNITVLEFPEGAYTLQVRSREQGKLWSEPVAFQIRISKPWYRELWAMTGFLVVAALLVYAATSLHNFNLIRQKRNLEEVVTQRTEEIDRQKNELIQKQNEIIKQKEELIAKNEAVYRSQQALSEADNNYHQLKEKQLQDEIEYKNKQITTHTLNILQKNEMLQQIRNQLDEIVKNVNKVSVNDLKRTLKTIDESFKLDKDWEDFRLYFEQIHSGFYSKLKLTYPDLTPLELRHCALIRLNLTLPECASILGISHDSLKVSRTRLRKKLNLEASQSLTDFIIGF